MSLEELVGTLKVHEQELQQDKGTKREKSLALSSQKNKKALSSREQVSRSLSKDLKADDSSDEFEEDEFTFISRKAAKYGETKVAPSEKTAQEECLKKKKIKKRAP